MVGRVIPGYGIDDNVGTTGRSLGYGSDTVTWVQQYPSSLRLQPIGDSAMTAVSRAAPGFSSAYSRTLDYGSCNCGQKIFGTSDNKPILISVGLALAVGTLLVLLVAKKRGWV